MACGNEGLLPLHFGTGRDQLPVGEHTDSISDVDALPTTGESVSKTNPSEHEKCALS